MTFFSSWDNLARTLVTGAIAYIALVAFLRVSGKRTLTKLNAFDLVVTVALGSTLASVLLPRGAALADGLLALALLISAQFVVAWLEVRVAGFRRLVTSEAALLWYRGDWLDHAMRRERVTRDDVLAALRTSGIAQFSEVEAVVLETDGSLSVVRPRGHQQPPASLAGVRGLPAGSAGRHSPSDQ